MWGIGSGGSGDDVECIVLTHVKSLIKNERKLTEYLLTMSHGPLKVLKFGFVTNLTVTFYLAVCTTSFINIYIYLHQLVKVK